MKLLFLLFFVILQFSCFSQTGETQKLDKQVNSLLELAIENNEQNGLKAILYVEEALKSEKKISYPIKLKLYKTAGEIYTQQQSYYNALKYFNKYLEIDKKDNVVAHTHIYNGIGNIYWRLENKDKAKLYWEKAIDCIQKSKDPNINIESYIAYNNLAVYEKSQGNYIKALKMLDEYKKHAINLKDSLGLVKAYQNISLNNIHLKELDTALLYLQKAKKVALKANLISDLGIIYNNLSVYYFESKPLLDSAKYFANKSYELGEKHQLPFIKKQSSEMLVDIFEKQKEYQQANHYLHIAKSLGEEITKDKNIKKISQIENEHIRVMHEKDLISLQKKKNIYYSIGGIVLILLLTITLLLYLLQKNKLKRRTVENELLIKKLEKKNKELTENAIQMLQTNEIIDITFKELSDLKQQTNLPTKKMLSKIIVDLKSGPKGFNKNEFEKLFKETHSDFYKNLLNKCPNLTRNEIRLCAFSKMNLSIKEISAITQQTTNSIIAARYRLRKKINLEDDKSLISFLAQF